MQYPDRPLRFMEENKVPMSGGMGDFFISVFFVLPFKIFWILLLLSLDIITIGRIGFVKREKSRQLAAKAKANELLPYDRLVYSRMEKGNNISKAESIVKKVLAERYEDLAESEVLEFGVFSKDRGVVFTSFRIFYYLESPKMLSSAAVDGIIMIKDLKSIACSKSFVDSIGIEINGERLGVIPTDGLGTAESVAKIERLFKVVQTSVASSGA